MSEYTQNRKFSKKGSDNKAITIKMLLFIINVIFF